MLEPNTIKIDEFEFIYSPLMLKPARALYCDLVNRYGDMAASIVEAFELTDKITLDTDIELDVLVNGITKSLGSGLRSLSKAIDADWLERTMMKTLIPQLQIKNEQGNFVPVDMNWYELTFGTKCSVEIILLLEILKIQYSDFLSRITNLSNTIKEIKKNVDKFKSHKD